MKSPTPTFTDTHCHIHEESYTEGEAAYSRALEAGITRMICVGTDVKTSREAVAFAEAHTGAWAAIGIHPHEAEREHSALCKLEALLRQAGTIDDRQLTIGKDNKNSLLTSTIHRPASTIVAIGEIGLDYYYNHSPREQQIAMFEAQIALALEYNLPISFHVREAFDDFWPIFDNFKGLRGVLHSFTDNLSNLEQGLSRGLLIGVNGIATFARDREMIYQAIPVNSLLFETDAPYLTPVPHRGKVNEPAFITFIAQELANLQSINLQELSQATERNASRLFSI